jgi:hypothetical protein
VWGCLAIQAGLGEFGGRGVREEGSSFGRRSRGDGRANRVGWKGSALEAAGVMVAAEIEGGDQCGGGGCAAGCHEVGVGSWVTCRGPKPTVELAYQTSILPACADL